MSHSIPLRLIALAGLLCLPGCLTSTQATRLQKDLEEVKRSLFEVQQETAGSRARIEDIDRKVSSMESEPQNQADLNATLRSILDQVAILSERVDAMTSRMDGLSDEVQSVQRMSHSPRPATGGLPQIDAPPPGADQTYKTAYSDYSKGNYELALLGFSDFLRSNPDHQLAPDAQYWIAECLYSQGKLEESIEAFEDTVDRFPGGERAVTSLLRKGFVQIESGQTSQGVATLQQLIEEHPDADEARLAADRLKGLGLRGQ